MTVRLAREPKPPCHPWCRPGRHVFTTEECQRGYENALLAIDTKYTFGLGLRCRHGAAFSHCFLRSKNPLYFEARKLRKKLDKLAQKFTQHDKEFKLLRARVALLEVQSKHATKPRKGEFKR